MRHNNKKLSASERAKMESIIDGVVTHDPEQGLALLRDKKLTPGRVAALQLCEKAAIVAWRAYARAPDAPEWHRVARAFRDLQSAWQTKPAQSGFETKSLSALACVGAGQPNQKTYE